MVIRSFGNYYFIGDKEIYFIIFIILDVNDILIKKKSLLK